VNLVSRQYGYIVFAANPPPPVKVKAIQFKPKTISPLSPLVLQIILSPYSPVKSGAVAHIADHVCFPKAYHKRLSEAGYGDQD